MSPGEIIKSLRIAKGLTTAQLAELAGTNQPQISRIENGQKCRADLEKRIADALGVNIYTFYSARPPADALASAVRAVPLLGFEQIGKENPTANQHVCTDLAVSPAAFAYNVILAAMEPEFSMGDTIIVDPAVTPQPGDSVIATNSGDPVFRKYALREPGIYELYPLNIAFPSYRSDRSDIRILGTVVEHKRYLGRRA